MFCLIISVSAEARQAYWYVDGGEAWGHPNPSGSYSIGFQYSSTQYQFEKIEVTVNWSYFIPATSDLKIAASSDMHVGLRGQKDLRPKKINWMHMMAPAVYKTANIMAGTIYPQKTVPNSCASCHIAYMDSNPQVEFKGNVSLYQPGSYIIQLKGYLPGGGEPIILAEIRRVLERFIFEANEIHQDGDNMVLTFIMFPLFGNSIEDGTSVDVQCGNYSYDSVINYENGNYFCSITMDAADFDRWILSNDVDTYFGIQGDLWRQHTEIAYPENIPWQRNPEWNVPY